MLAAAASKIGHSHNSFDGTSIPTGAGEPIDRNATIISFKENSP